MSYTNVNSLVEYLSVGEEDLPDDIDRMIDRATELVEEVCMGRIDKDKDRHLEVLEKAVNAQIEYWIEVGDELGVMYAFDKATIGSVSISQDKKLPVLSPRTKRVLLTNGLLNKGIKMR